ncbi:MAG: GNAT family N-acetyltransferase [Jaaginema sp. PMC 1079.18]|nr:GNAT family N-acetyltransferase [Jaaginema sp. PMC 1080.18]MEC4853457.1 GNAT family N-acetyltransferase [Jaaginema sp. PMC 1079.18]MEC4867809.1 GNAT family N-acetyltransferase [Jaaginema sp. PMC 1078.18]
MFELVEEIHDNQLDDLLTMYHQVWWSRERQKDDVLRMLRHSDLVLGIVHVETHQLIGFTRILTDFVYRATIWDVMVHTQFQGQGLGRVLLNGVISHGRLQEVELMLLICTVEMMPFYEKFDFTREIKNDLRLMQRVRLIS